MILIWNILIITLRSFICFLNKISPKYFHLEFDFFKILEKNYAVNEAFYFIQVGANDGISYDNLFFFLKSRNSAGLAIEPLMDFYQQLISNYGFTNKIKLVNKAVHSTLNKVTLYRIDPNHEKYFPNWVKGIASINETHHKKSKIPSEFIIKEEVPAEHLMELVKKYYHYDKIDLIQIDAEGYDFQILKMIDFNILKPKMIRFEIESLQHHECIEAKEILKKLGYYSFLQYPDLIAINPFSIRI